MSFLTHYYNYWLFRKANQFIKRVRNKGQVTNKMASGDKETGLDDDTENCETDEDQWEYYDDNTTLTDLWSVSIEILQSPCKRVKIMYDSV